MAVQKFATLATLAAFLATLLALAATAPVETSVRLPRQDTPLINRLASGVQALYCVSVSLTPMNNKKLNLAHALPTFLGQGIHEHTGS